MDPSQSESASPAPDMIPQIRLVGGEEGCIVHPPDGFALQSFPLPPLPLSMLSRCAIMAESFWERRQRCLGFLLMIDCQRRIWACGIPRQRCSYDSACWNVARADYLDLPPKAAIAGSFQSRLVEAEGELLDAVPPSPGLHLVHRLSHELSGTRAFLRTEDACFAVRPSQIVYDDWTIMLDLAESRLTMV